MSPRKEDLDAAAPPVVPPRRLAPYALGGSFSHAGALHHYKCREGAVPAPDASAALVFGATIFRDERAKARGKPRILDDNEPLERHARGRADCREPRRAWAPSGAGRGGGGGAVGGGSRHRRGCDVDIPREVGRGTAAAATWTFRGAGSRVGLRW